MPSDDILALLGKSKLRDGAPPKAIAALQRWAGAALPEAYLALLRASNGTEGFVSEFAYLLLWSAEEVPEFNEGYEAAEFAPGLLLIGSDGGGNAYAFDIGRQPMAVMEVPFIPMSLDEVGIAGFDFEDFLTKLGRRASDDDDVYVLMNEGMRKLYGDFYEERTTMVKDPPWKLNPANVPEEFHPLIPYAEFWGITDDTDREDFLDATPAVVRNNFTDVIETFDLDPWLDGPESESDERSDEFVAFWAMRMAANYLSE